MKKTLAVLTLCIMAGCSTISEIYTDYPRQVAIMQASLAAAEHTALVYCSLPVCGKTTAVTCRTPDLTAKIGAADNVAFSALQAARQAEDETTVGAAQTAIVALQDIVNNLPITGK